MLAELGIARSADRLVHDENEAAAAAGEMAGSVALKVQSPGISHRARVGAVGLALETEAAVRDAYRSILENARRAHPGADIHGVLVSPMSAAGVEIIVGIQRDPQFGPMLVLGAGGTLVEVLDEVLVTPAPATPSRVWDLLAGWKGFRLLDGSAGTRPADADALVTLAVEVSRFAAAAPEVASLDLNPVIVHPRGRGVSVVDALIVTAPPGADDTHSMAAD